MENDFGNLEALHTLFIKQNEIDRKLEEFIQRNKSLEDEVLALVIIFDAFNDIVDCSILFFSLKKKKGM